MRLPSVQFSSDAPPTPWQVFTVWFDHPVNKMFADFKHRHTHLAFVQRVNDEDDTRDPFYELQASVWSERH